MRTAIVGLILIYGLQIIKADDMKVLFLAPPEAKIKTNRHLSPVREDLERFPYQRCHWRKRFLRQTLRWKQ